MDFPGSQGLSEDFTIVLHVYRYVCIYIYIYIHTYASPDWSGGPAGNFGQPTSKERGRWFLEVRKSDDCFSPGHRDSGIFGTNTTVLYGHYPSEESGFQRVRLKQGLITTAATAAPAAKAASAATTTTTTTAFGWHYLSNATCLIRPHSLYVCFVVSRTTISCYIICQV